MVCVLHRSKAYHQTVGSIIDGDQQATCRTTSLEPIVWAVVELDERANRRTRKTLLPVRTLLATARPQAGTDEPARCGLAREAQFMIQFQLFHKQCRAIVGVLFPIQPQRFRSGRLCWRLALVIGERVLPLPSSGSGAESGTSGAH